MTSITVDPSLEEYFGHGCTSLAGIDVSRCQNLRILQIYDNALVAVDVTHNPELISIQAQNNALTSVDLTQNPVLVSAILSDNSLTAINVQNNPLLETLDVGHNNLSAVNVTHNPALKVLKVNNNAGISIVNIIWNTSIETLDISFTGVTTLDTSKNVSLTEIQATGTPYSLQFKIGDYLEILGGIVFSNDGVVVKIVSIDEKEEQWGYYGTSIGATSTTDGVVNTNKIADKSNAAKWCRAKGANWYFPARQELQLIFDNKEIINSVLSSLGKELLDTSTGMYWSSTEGNANCAYCIHMNTGSWTNYTKTASFTVRAIRTL
jgi:hypothetical protein